MDILKTLALTGGDWVIWLLILSSVAALGIIIERWTILKRELQWFEMLRTRLAAKLEDAELATLAADSAKAPGLAARIFHAGAVQAGQGVAAVEEHIAAAGITERAAVERRLLVLGTLGNNAPFVGLFGTVLGVIKAFHDLAQSAGAGPEVVMQGLSEALIATAVGLFVAIPCVIAYNYFQRQVKDLMGGVESMSRLLVARLKSQKRH